MSRKRKLVHSLQSANAKIGGSCGTRASRKSLCNGIVSALQKQFPHLISAEQIGLRHVRAFLQQRKAKGLSVRSLQNDVAHVRNLLRDAGRDELLREPGMTNGSLGISGASRLGTKTPIGDSELSALLTSINDARFICLLHLQRDLGLRALEAIRSCESLSRWKRDLEEGKSVVEVFFGTKGGRRRQTHLPNPKRALAAISVAVKVIDAHGHLAPGQTLKEATTWFRNKCHRVGLQSHRLRYTFANVCVDHYLASGYSMREAFARTAVDLGHGDGRGRWIKMVYCRHKNFGGA